MDKLTKWMRELRIARVEVPPDEAGLHLAALVDAFVIPTWRERAHRLLGREPWGSVAGRIEQHLDPAPCRLDDAQSRPTGWSAPFVGEGLYVTPNAALRMQIEQASLLSARCASTSSSHSPLANAPCGSTTTGACGVARWYRADDDNAARVTSAKARDTPQPSRPGATENGLGVGNADASTRHQPIRSVPPEMLDSGSNADTISAVS